MKPLITVVAISVTAFFIATGCTTCPLCGRPYDNRKSALAADIANIPSLNGTVTYLDRVTVHPSAVVDVCLWKLSTPSGNPELVASKTIEHPESVPLKFSIPLEHGKILKSQDYGVTARISVSGETLFKTDTEYLVLTGGHPSEIQLVLTRSKLETRNKQFDKESNN